MIREDSPTPPDSDAIHPDSPHSAQDGEGSHGSARGGTEPAWGQFQPWEHGAGSQGAPYGWTYDPWRGYVPYYPPAPVPVTVPRRRIGPLAIAIAIAVGILSGVVGAGVGLHFKSSTTSYANISGSQTQNNPTIDINAAGIANSVDPSIVDVVNTLAGENSGLALGTGIILSTSGLILTNNHVIDGAASVTVQIDGKGPQIPVTVLGYNRVVDIAVLQINDTSGQSLKVAPLGNSTSVRVGQSVLAIGNAYGNGGTPAAVSGNVTGLDQAITASDGQASESLTGMIQTNAEVVVGDSGGPLLNDSGKIIGVNTAGSAQPQTVNGQTITQGFAIPINTALQAASLIEEGKSGGDTTIGGGPFLGVDIAASAGSVQGALIQGVLPNTPADSEGLVAGDVITSINGEPITDAVGVNSALADLHSGEVIQLGWTDTAGQPHTGSLKLGSGPPR